MRYFRKIVGDRLYLSPMNSDDYEIYTKWMNDFEVDKGINQLINLIGIDAEKEYLQKAVQVKYNFAIVLKEEDRLLGNISLTKINEIDRTAELGIFIGEESDRNKGYGTEAIKLLLDYGFNQLNLHNISLNAFSFNLRAIAAYKKAGFVEFGRWKEAHYFNGEYCDIVMLQILKKDFNK